MVKILDMQPLRNSGWIMQVEIKRLCLWPLRIEASREQFFTYHPIIDYEYNDWYYADDGLQIDASSMLGHRLTNVAYTWFQAEQARKRVHDLDMQVVSRGNKRIPIR